MNELLAFVLDQRKIKGALNIIFICSITSFVFERYYFKYRLLPIDDVNSIYDFFIRGHFIVPFALFYAFWILTIALRMLLFQVPNAFISKKFGSILTKFMVWYLVSKKSKFSSPNVLPKSKSLDWVVKSLPDTELEDRSLIKKTLQSHQSLESDFTLVLRGFIAITLYFISIDYFGWRMFLILLLILLFTWILQFMKYQFVEATPTLFRFSRDQSARGR